MRNVSKRALVVVLAALAIVAAAALLWHPRTALTSKPAADRPDIFSRNDHFLIARSVAEGSPRSALILAVEPTSTQSVAEQIRNLGGKVRFEADEVGYLRIVLPNKAVPSLQNIGAIRLANFSPPNQFDVELNDVKVRRIAATSLTPDVPDGLPTPSAATPKVNDFTGVAEVGAPQFIKAHATFDGRGVRIAVFEPIEPAVPYLQNARDLDGHIVPKLIMRHYTTDPSEMDAKSRRKFGWVDMHAIVHAGPYFQYAGHRYQAPGSGEYHIGVFSPRALWSGSYGWHNTRHPQGTSYGGPLDYAVLWDKARELVWVDTNQDGNFAKQPALTDYDRRPSYGVLHLHTDFWAATRFYVFDKSDQAPDAFPFVVQTDSKASEVAVFLTFDDHSVMVASSAAGSGMFDGAFDGMAPGAQILSYDQGDDFPYLVESMILAARAGVDMMTLQFGVSYNFDNGRDVWDEIAHRLVQHYNVIITDGADNDGPTMNTVFTPSAADGVFSVGGYVRGKRVQLLYGAAVTGVDYLADYSSRGPRGDGGFKPDFLAPTEWLAGTSAVAPHGLLRRGVQLPTGYEIGGGTSQASPSAVGAIALLVSAAKQTHIAYSPAMIRDALMQTTRVIPGYQAYEQGAGLINVPAAWEALKRISAAQASTAPDSQDQQVIADAPVVTVRSGDLAVPGKGVGLYEREGWHVGMQAQRMLGFTRTSGPSGSLAYTVRWKQNDGTFTSPATLTLARGERAELPVSVLPRTSGAHSAILELVDPQSGNAVLHQLNTVVAASQFTAANNFTITHSDTLPHRDVVHYFLNVPPNTDLLRIALHLQHGDTAEFFKLWTEELVDVHLPDGTKPALESALMPYHDGDEYARVYPKPMPGVWEIAVDNQTPSYRYADTSVRAPLPPTHLTFTASVYAMRTLAASKANNGYRLQLVNTEAPLHPRVTSSDVGLVKQTNVTLSPAQPRAVVPIIVPRETSEVEVAAARLDSGGGSDADIFLFNCAKNVAAAQATWAYQGACEYKAGSHLSTGGHATTALPAAGEGQLLQLEPNPQPGRWIAVIDASRFISAPMHLRVQSILKSGKFGTVKLTTADRFVPSGGRWIATVTTSGGHHNIGDIYSDPVLNVDEADTISEILPRTMNASVTLKAQPIVSHTYTPIWLTNPSRDGR